MCTTIQSRWPSYQNIQIRMIWSFRIKRKRSSLFNEIKQFSYLYLLTIFLIFKNINKFWEASIGVNTDSSDREAVMTVITVMFVRRYNITKMFYEIIEKKA